MAGGDSRAQVRIIQGNEACVEGAIVAGCRFFAGYPITPASEIAELMARRLPQVGGVFMQMEDELASICAVMGAVWGGVKACTASSGPGISLMQEGVGYAAETETPCVIINVMRGGPSTGQPTLASQQDVYQAKYGSHGDYEIIALAPSSAQEAFDLTVKAFNLAETYRVPVYVLSDEIVGHTRERVQIDPSIEIVPRIAPSKEGYQAFCPGADGLLHGMPAFNDGYRLLVEGQLHDETGNRVGHDVDASARLVRRLCEKITSRVDDLTDVEEIHLDDAEVAVVCYGSSARSALEAVDSARRKGIRAGIFRLRVLFPFPERRVAALARKVRTLIVPEMNTGKIVLEVERAAAGTTHVIGLSKLGGDMHTPDEIFYAIKSALGNPPCQGGAR